MKIATSPSIRFLALVLVLSPAASARNDGEPAKETSCEPTLLTQLVERRKPLTMDQAEAIVGPSTLGDVRPQIAKAVAYVLALPDNRFRIKRSEMKTLLEAVRRTSYFTWNYTEAVDHGGIGNLFIGDQDDQFIFIAKNGRIYRGRMNPDDISKPDPLTGKGGGVWNGHARQFREITGR